METSKVLLAELNVKIFNFFKQTPIEKEKLRLRNDNPTSLLYKTVKSNERQIANTLS